MTFKKDFMILSKSKMAKDYHVHFPSMFSKRDAKYIVKQLNASYEKERHFKIKEVV